VALQYLYKNQEHQGYSVLVHNRVVPTGALGFDPDQPRQPCHWDSRHLVRPW